MKLLKVKKYNNRKLYIDDIGMVTNKKLLNEIKNGAQIKVTCHDTGLDLTRDTLLNILKLTDISTNKINDLIKE